MKITLLSLLIILSLSAVTLAQKSGQDGAIHSAIQQLITAQTAYNTSTIDKLLTTDYNEVSPLGELDPRDKVLTFYSPEAKAASGNISASVVIAEEAIRTYGTCAIAIVRLDYKMTSDDGKPLSTRSIRATYVLRRERDVWKIASAQYTGIRAKTS